jgi:cytochrome c oxidase cbb3-type subunit 2
VKNNFVFFLGLFAALGVSWAGIVIGSNAQLGSLPPYYDDNDQTTHPEWMAGEAARGQLVYRDLGCVACHTQQVRRPGFGSDQERGWGDRQSVARDYIYQPFPQIGYARIGPDLANLGDRKPSAPDAEDLLNLLYSGSSGMPSYRFLFEKRQIGAGAQPSNAALKLTGALKPADGWEIVPKPRAEVLAAYLANLKNTYTYPEAAPFNPPKPEGEDAKAAPVAAPAAAAAPSATPAAAPASGAPAPAPAKPEAKAPAPAAAPEAGAPAAAPASGAAAQPAPSPMASGSQPTPSPTAAAPAGNAPAAAPAAAPAVGAPAQPTPSPTASGSQPTPSPTAAAPSGNAPATAPAAAPAAGAPAQPTPSPTTAAPAGGAPAAAAPSPTAAAGASTTPTPSPTGTTAPASTGGSK